MRKPWLIGCTFLLAACAHTPEQRALRQAQAQRAQQVLAAQLAEQCDPQAAAWMRRQADNPSLLADAALAAEAERYRQAVSNPLFQSCYRLAWANHVSQMRLQAAQQMYMRARMDDMSGWNPLWCPGYGYGRPMWRRCDW